MNQTMNMKIRKANMDNTMTAIVSSIMIAFGFVSGLIISDLLNTESLNKLHNALNQAADKMFKKDQQIDELKEALEKEKDLNLELIECLAREKQKSLDILESVQNVVDEYDVCLPRIVEPPRGPLKRSRACMESESDSEDGFVCPTSPDPVLLGSKD
jgi:hypothetical protein